MKTPLGTEVDLGPSHIVLDGVPLPTKGAPQYRQQTVGRLIFEK